MLAGNDLRFGDVPVDDRNAPSTSSITLRLTNQASCPLCDLRLTSLAVSGPHAGDFVVGAPALPATLTVGTDDPATASQDVALSATGLLSGIWALPDPVIFDPTVITPACGVSCGTTRDVRISNTGQAELIVDGLGFSHPAYTGPGATDPPARIAPNGFFDEPVTFTPTAIDRSVTVGTLSTTQTVNLAPNELKTLVVTVG